MTLDASARSAALERLKGLYDACDRQGISRMAAEIGGEAFRDLHLSNWIEGKLEKDFARPDAPTKALDLAILGDLATLGVDLSPIVPDLMEAVIVKDSTAGLAFLRNRMGCAETFGSYLTYSWILSKAGPGLAAELAREMDGLPDRLLASGTRFEPGILPDYCLGCYGGKEFAVLLTANCDIRPIFDAPDLKGAYAGLGPNIRRLIEDSGSSHGRMRLRALEPSLEAIIGRDPLGSFYGLDEPTLHRELSVGGMTPA